MRELTPDLLFSYWLFFWFVIYYILVTVKTPISSIIKNRFYPLLAFHAATIYDTMQLLNILVKNPNINIIIKYLLTILFLKIVPIWIMMQQNIGINYLNDITIMIIIFGIYNLYLYTKNTNVSNIYTEENDAIVKGENITPFFKFLNISQYFLK
jgi:hypothetical protein